MKFSRQLLAHATLEKSWMVFQYPLDRKARLITLIFYTTAGCHLCEHAEVLLEEFSGRADSPQFDLEEVDISTDDYLVELYGIRIPVVKNSANEKEIGWPFSFEDITTLF